MSSENKTLNSNPDLVNTEGSNTDTVNFRLNPLLWFLGEVYGHGNIVWPYTWFDAGGRVGMTAGSKY